MKSKNKTNNAAKENEFVNANKNHLHPDILRKNAVDIASAITGDKMFSTNRKFNSAAVISTIMGVAMLVLLLIALCM